MNLTNHLNFARLWLLMKMQLFRSRKGILMTLVIVFGISITGLLLETYFDHKKVVHTHDEGYAFVLLVTGFIFSSMAFQDLGHSLKRFYYLMLPASAFEKFLSAWLLSSVGWTILFTIFFTIYAYIANVIGGLFFSQVDFRHFQPFSEATFTTFRYYFVLQGIFLVGAVHFRGYVLPKTLFTLILAAAGLAAIGYLVMADIIHSDTECTEGPDALLNSASHRVWQLAKWLFWWTLAPLCWVATYLGIKDQEV